MLQPYAEANENVQLLADRLEISSLLLELATAIDQREFALLDAIFTPDAFIDLSKSDGCKGRYMEIKQSLQQFFSYRLTNQHRVSAAAIRLNGDRASGATCCGEQELPKTSASEVRNLYYEDQFLRTNQGWRIIQRKLVEGPKVERSPLNARLRTAHSRCSL